MKLNKEKGYKNIIISFENYFKDWGANFPRTLYEFGILRALMKDGGWELEYSVDYDNNDLPELFIIAHERHSLDIKIKICNNGEIVPISTKPAEIFRYLDENRKNTVVKGFSTAYFRRSSAYNIISGCVGPSISIKHGIENIFYQGVKGEYRYNQSTDKLHPDFYREFRYKGRVYNSISHCLNFYRIYYSLQENNLKFDELEIIELAKNYNINGYPRDSIDTGDPKSGSKGSVIMSKEWLEKRVRIIFEAQMKLAIQNKDILDFILNKVSYEFIFENPNSFWGSGELSPNLISHGKNSLGLIQASACFWLYYAYIDNPKII